MSKIPFFSIVIVNFNHGRFLEEAIQSILNQSCDDYELLIVDGGSTDNSLSIIKKYETKLSWWVSEKDNGQSEAFNKGFSKAKGKYFFWINADDLLLPYSLYYAKKKIIENPDFLWFTANMIFFSEEGRIIKCARGPRWREFLFRFAPINVHGPTAIFHRSIFEKVGGFDENLVYAMDTDLWMRFKNNGLKYYRIHKYFWGFRLHEKSKTSNQFWGIKNIYQENENLEIIKKNKIKYTKTGLYFQYFYKTISGIYLLSFIDSIRFSGKQISEMKF